MDDLSKALTESHNSTVAMLDLSDRVFSQWRGEDMQEQHANQIQQAVRRVCDSWTDDVRDAFRQVGSTVETCLPELTPVWDPTRRTYFSARCAHEVFAELSKEAFADLSKEPDPPAMRWLRLWASSFISRFRAPEVRDGRPSLSELRTRLQQEYDDALRSVSPPPTMRAQVEAVADESKQVALARRFFEIVDAAAIHADYRRNDAPDRRTLAMFSVGATPAPEHHQLESLLLEVRPGAVPGLKQTFALAQNLQRFLSTKRRDFQETARKISEHGDDDDWWMYAVAEWLDAKHLEVTVARTELALAVPVGIQVQPSEQSARCSLAIGMLLGEGMTVKAIATRLDLRRAQLYENKEFEEFRRAALARGKVRAAERSDRRRRRNGEMRDVRELEEDIEE